MSLCDVCMSPGACCKRVALTDLRPGELVVPQDPMSHEQAEHWALRAGLPFRPAEQGPDGVWRWSCNNLLETGRCGDYENRPSLCRKYRPGSDPLCVHYWPREPEVAAAA